MRPKLLFLSQCLPYPPHSGVTNRTFNMLTGLAKAFDITLLAFTRRNHQSNPTAVLAAEQALGAYGIIVRKSFDITSERSLFAKLSVHAMSAVSGAPYTYFEYGNQAFKRVLEQAVEEDHPDLIHVDSLDLHRWIPAMEGYPVACTHHSIESDLLRQRARRATNPFLQKYLYQQADAIQSIERAVCPKLALNVMMSEIDADRLQQLAPAAHTFVAPNGVDLDKIRPLPHIPIVKDRVVFLGPSYMLPNRDGIEWFLRDVWPSVRALRPEATFQILGKVADAHRRAFEAAPAVTCRGFVPDLQLALAEAACCVVPLRIGGGTRLKVLDSWAMARPIVSTSIGAEGLDTQDGVNILIRDDPGLFALAVASLLEDDLAAGELGARGRHTAEARYGWDMISSSLAKEYHALLA